MLRFGVTIFLSAFLLFQIQPLIGKFILPWFGGGPAVWTTCMLFFQLALLAGYAYAHWSSSRLPARVQSSVHLILLAGSLLVLPIAPSPEVWKPEPGALPTAHILMLLMATVGLPYLLLSSTAPLVQHWFREAIPGHSPYRLYSLSNTGSLLALLSYPFLFEPWLALDNQILSWSLAYAGFAVLSGWSAFVAGFLTAGAGEQDRQPESTFGRALPSYRDSEEGARSSQPPTVGVVSLWLSLSAMASALLLATTNLMCQEVAVVPFLWVVPLAIYLLTFIISFDNERWYDRRLFGFLVGASVAAALSVMSAGLAIKLPFHILIHSVTLFACCMCCHGELVKAKPHPRYLTLFYLVVAAGGALGGVFVALVAPRIFNSYWEYPVALAGCGVLTLMAWYRARAWEPYMNRPHWVIGPMAGMMLSIVVSLILMSAGTGPKEVMQWRSFYGVLRLAQEDDGAEAQLLLTHGRVVHGGQFLAADRRSWPTAYYGPESAIGLAMRYHPRRLNAGDRSLRVGVVGLGAGTIATHGQPGDYIRFYEINSDVIAISEQHFTYRADSAATVEVIAGDARVRMEAELARHRPQQLDILAVDAFNSDSIPIHLLTKESAEVYWGHLKPDGLLLFHISNQTVDLEPVVRGLAQQFGSTALRIFDAGDQSRGVKESVWMIVTKNQAFLSAEEIQRAAASLPVSHSPRLLWTDDFASLWQVLKF